MKQIKLITTTLILCMFVGGASAGITYDAPTNTITVTGYSEAAPCTFNDIYNADVAGGWGRISKYGDNTFHIDRLKINFGDGIIDTWFCDINKVILVKGWVGRHWYINNNTVFRLGVLENSSLKTVSSGCVLSTYMSGPTFYKRVWWYVKPDAQVLLYDSKFMAGGASFFSGSPTNTKIYGCTFGNHFYFERACGDFYRTNFFGNKNTDVAPMAFNFLGGTFQDLYISGRKRAICFENLAPINMINLKIRDCTTSFFVVTLFDINIINSDIDVWSFDWVDNATVNRQYTLNLQTTPNAKITIMNHTDIVYQDYAYDNGTIDEPILTMGHYTHATGNTLNSQNPYSIEIKKAGYHTYTQKFVIVAPIKWHIMLLPDRVQVGSKIIRPARRS